MSITVRWFDGKAREISREGAIDALTRASEFLLAKANETVPIEEGTLKNSGDTDVDEHDLVAAVSYNTPYAAQQHEDVQYHHKEGRRAKWLQLTMEEQARQVRSIYQEALKRRFPG